jgi:hypothetical protein
MQYFYNYSLLNMLEYIVMYVDLSISVDV